MFVFLAIVVVWAAIIAIAVVLPGANGFTLYIAAQTLTLMLFYVGFFRK